jgi:glucokinase
VCACGNRGCFEAVAAGPAMVRRTLEGWAAGRNGRGAGHAAESGPATDASAPAGARLSGAEGVFAAAQAGDEGAREVIEATGRAIAWGIHLLALAYDVERIVLGGGVSHAGEPFMAPIQRQLDRYRTDSRLAAEILRPDLVQLLPPGSEAGTWGAITVARESLGLGWESPGTRLPAVPPQGREVGHA